MSQKPQSSIKDIAHVLIQIAEGKSKEDMSAMCDSALELLHHHHQGTSLRSFAALVAHLTKKKAVTIPATLISPDGNADPAIAQQMIADLEKLVGKQVILEQKADATMIGGAVLLIGDERFDLSVPHALELLRDSLLEH